MKILLVRLRLIGDVVFTTPVIRALRRHYPDAHLTYLVEPAAAPVVRGNPHLNEVIVTPRRSGLRRLSDDLRLARRLRRDAYDIVIDLHGGPRAAWLAWATRAPMRIGYAIAGRAWMYTHVVPRSPDLVPRHSVRNQFDLLHPLGIADCDPARDAVEMAADPEIFRRVGERLRACGVGPDNPLVVIHVSAGNPFRRWPADSFAELAAALIRQDTRRRVIIISGPSEQGAAAAITQAARQRLGAHGSAVREGTFDIAEVRALAARATVYIGNDSGPLHIAATTESPIVEILGPTLAERSRPWRDPRHVSEMVDAGALPCRPCHQRQCVPGDFRCLTGITVDRVIAAAERAFQSGRASFAEGGAEPLVAVDK